MSCVGSRPVYFRNENISVYQTTRMAWARSELVYTSIAATSGPRGHMRLGCEGISGLVMHAEGR